MNDQEIKNMLTERNLTIEKILNFIKYENDDTIYLSGSLIEGFGNLYSDIDVYVISKETNSYIRNFPCEDLFIDFEFWNEDRVLNIISRLNKLNFDDPNEFALILSNAEKKFLHRLIIGFPVINNNKFLYFKNLINEDKFVRLNIRTYITSYDNVFEDLRGSLEKKDFLTAYLLCKDMLYYSIEAYLASLGEKNVQQKWIIQKLLKNLKKNDPIYKKYIDFILRGVAIETIEEYINQAIQFSEELLGLVQDKTGGI